MSKKLKEFYGAISLTAKISFLVKAKDKETAENIVFDDIEGIELTLKDGSKLEISEIDWNLIDEARKGNVSQTNISHFEIQEES